MGFRHSMALNFSPLLLRVALGVTFFYAGWGKVFEKSEFAPEQVAVLANMGFGKAKSAALGGAGPVEAAPLDSAPAKPEPADALPEPGRVSNPVERSSGRVVLARQDHAGEQGAGEALNAATQSSSAPAAPSRLYRASDFAGPVMLSRTHFIGLAMHGAAYPADGGRQLLPTALVNRPWGWALSHGASLTELVGGALILIGLLTRLSALGLAVVMGMAIWLTTVGPSLGASGAFLGVLPAVGRFDSDAWQTWLLQLILFCAALAVFFSGPGAVSVDRLLMGRRGGEDGGDDEGEEE